MAMTARVPDSEWGQVARFAATLVGDQAVRLRSDGDERRWTGCRDGLEWMIRGGPECNVYEHELPRELVWFADDLAHRDGACDLSLSDDLATVRSSTGSAAFDLRPCSELTLHPWPTVGVRATLPTDRLLHLVGVTTRSVSAAADDATILIAAEYGEVAVSAHDGAAYRATYRTAATCDGREAVAVSVWPMLLILSCLADTVEEVTIDFPVHGEAAIGLRGEGWGAVIPVLDLSVLRWSHQLASALRFGDHEPTQAAAGVFHLHDGHRLFRAALHDGPPEVVRISTVLTRGLQASDVLRDQVNAANQALSGVRMWWSKEDEVVAAIDVPCTGLESIPSSIDHLSGQIRGFDVYLGAIGG